MALEVQGFGGFAWDTTNGDLVITVKDLSRRGSGQAVVAQYLATNYAAARARIGGKPTVRVQLGHYDFLELGSIRDRVAAAIEKEAGVAGWGIDTRNNVVDILLEGNAAPRIIEILSRAGIPKNAVHLDSYELYTAADPYNENDPTTFPPAFDDEPTDTTLALGAPLYLDSWLALVGGGARISYYRSVQHPLYGMIAEVAGCTSRPMVRNSAGQARMLTASHCSGAWASMDRSSVYYQPRPQPRDDKIQPSSEFPFALEDTDPAWKTSFPSFSFYRRSDALLAAPVLNRPQAADVGHYPPAYVLAG